MRFELMRGVTPYLVSSEALSTTQPTLQYSIFYPLFLVTTLAGCSGLQPLYTLWLFHTLRFENSSQGLAKVPRTSLLTEAVHLVALFIRFALKTAHKVLRRSPGPSHPTSLAVRRFRPQDFVLVRTCSARSHPLSQPSKRYRFRYVLHHPSIPTVPLPHTIPSGHLPLQGRVWRHGALRRS